MSPAAVSPEQVAEDIQRVAEENGVDTVASTYYDANGEYSLQTVWKYFGDWETAADAAGVEAPKKGYDREECLQALQDVGEAVDGALTREKYDSVRDDNQPAADTIRGKFGSWSDAVEAAGFTSGQDKQWDREDVVDALRSVAEKVDGPLTQQEYKERRGEEQPGIGTVKDRFGGWNAAKEAAGLETIYRGKATGKEQVGRYQADLETAEVLLQRVVADAEAVDDLVAVNGAQRTAQLRTALRDLRRYSRKALNEARKELDEVGDQ